MVYNKLYVGVVYCWVKTKPHWFLVEKNINFPLLWACLSNQHPPSRCHVCYLGDRVTLKYQSQCLCNEYHQRKSSNTSVSITFGRHRRHGEIYSILRHIYHEKRRQNIILKHSHCIHFPQSDSLERIPLLYLYFRPFKFELPLIYISFENTMSI